MISQAAINAEADKAGAAGNSDLMAKLKAAATNKKIQGAFMDVKNNGVSAAMKYKDVRGLCGNQIYGALVLNRRVDLHAIDATPARWRGDAGSSLLDRARTAASSPRNDLVKNCRCTRRTD